MNPDKEERYLIDEKDLPIVLVHGTMGESENWSRVVEELSNSRAMIRPELPETSRWKELDERTCDKRSRG